MAEFKGILNKIKTESLTPLVNESKGIRDILLNINSNTVKQKETQKKFNSNMEKTLENLERVSEDLNEKINDVASVTKSVKKEPKKKKKKMFDKVTTNPNEKVVAESLDPGSLYIVSQMRDIFGGDKKEEKGGGGGLLGLLGKGLLGMGAGIGLLFSGFKDDGPFKGLKKVVGKIFTSIGLNFLDAFKRGFKALFSSKVGKEATEGVGKKIFKNLIGDNVKKIFTAMKGSLDNILGKLFKSFGKTTAKVVGGGVAEKGAKGIFKKLVPKLTKGLKGLKFVPFLGSIISFGFAYSRFKKGDVFGGILEIVSGIGDLIPGIGTAISWGIDIFLALRDLSKTKKGEKIKSGIKNIFKVIYGKVKNFIMKHKDKFQYIPGIGTIMQISDGIKMIKKGDLFGGILKLTAGVASVIPGMGTAISIGLNFINSLRTQKGKEKFKEKMGKALDFAKMIGGKVKGFIVKHKKYFNHVPGIGTILQISDGIKMIKKGDLFGGILKIIGGVAASIPGLGTAVSIGLSFIQTLRSPQGKKKFKEKMGKALDFGKLIAEKFKKKSKEILEPIGDFFTGIFDKVVGFFKKAWSGVKNIGNRIWEAVSNFFGDVLGNITSGFEDLTGEDKSFKERMKGLLQIVFSVPISLFNSIKDKLLESDLFNSVVDVIKDKIISPITNIFNKLKSFFGYLGSFFKRGIDGISELGSKIFSGTFSEGLQTYREEQKAIERKNKAMGGTAVQDAIIKPDGSVIHTALDDTIIATKNPVTRAETASNSRTTNTNNTTNNVFQKADNSKLESLLTTLITETKTLIAETRANRPVTDDIGALRQFAME